MAKVYGKDVGRHVSNVHVNWSVEVVLCHFGNCCCNLLTFFSSCSFETCLNPREGKQGTT